MHIQKYIFPLIVTLSLCLPAYATETEGEVTELTPETVVEVTEDEPATLVGVEVYGLSPVTSDDTTGLKSVLLEFIGEYDPVIVEYEYENNNGYSSFLREVQPDYVWLSSCAMLALFVLSLFKLGGALLCRR